MVPLAVRPEDLATILAALPRMGFVGANLTLPHKQAALLLMDEVDDAARAIGAVNTVTVRDGRLFGSNSDGYGFVAHLTHSFPEWSKACDRAVVLGAGGAARGIAYALAAAGVPRIALVNRTADKAQLLAESLHPHVSCRFDVVAWRARAEALAGASVVVNTTSLGMAGQPPLDIALDALPPGALVADIVYVPLETPLLKAAAARGHPVLDGLGMLIHQARPGFQAWFGRDPEVTDDVRRALLMSLKDEGA